MRWTNICFCLFIALTLMFPWEVYASADVGFPIVSIDLIDASNFRVAIELTNDDDLKISSFKIGNKDGLHEVNKNCFEKYRDIDLSKLSVTHGSTVKTENIDDDTLVTEINVISSVTFGLYSHEGAEASKNREFELSFVFSDGRLIVKILSVEENGIVKNLEFIRYGDE